MLQCYIALAIVHLIDGCDDPSIVLESWDTERSHIKNSVQYLHQTDHEMTDFKGNF